MSEDLFGDEIPDEPLPVKSPPRAVINDMDVIADVLRAACSSEPYVLFGPGQKVYRRADKTTMRPVARWEDAAVHQLLNSGQLSLGGQHLLRNGAIRGRATSVLVPSSTRAKLTRWENLSKPRTWRAD